MPVASLVAPSLDGGHVVRSFGILSTFPPTACGLATFSAALAPSFEAVMPIAGAVVTAVGGLMSHTAICCREYGIPAVPRVAGATTHITDGALITVDPSTGRVLVGVTALNP